MVIMAGISNQSRNKSCQSLHDIVFDGALLSSTRAVLVTELLHYFLYERQQIPLPVDQLNLRTAVWASDSDSTDQIPPSFSKSKEFRPDLVLQRHCQFQANKRNASDRKAKSLLADLRHLSNKLKKAFETCTEVQQVAILCGGTALNPKESLLIKFPPPCPDADCLPLDACKRTLFKQIISEDILGSLPANTFPSNINVLLLAPRALPISWFLPKHSLKAPATGTIVSINFHCVYLVPICHELTIQEESNISGLEALDCSQCEREGFEGNSNTSEGDSVSRSSCKLFNRCSHIDETDGDFSRNQCLNAETSYAVTSQFCQHEKLNYIFSASEKHYKKVITSPSGRILPSSFVKSSSLISSPFANCVHDTMAGGDHTCHDQPCHQISDLNLENGVDESIIIKDNSIDCIWYQSPLTLKGFRE